MAMCLSGSLGILSSPQGGCSSISVAVCGNATPPKSLCGLSISAGKTANHCMREFYGYAPAPVLTYMYMHYTNPYYQGCLAPALSAGHCFNLSLLYQLDKMEFDGAGTASIVCNGNQVFFCGVYDIMGESVSGYYNLTVRYNDCVNFCVSAWGSAYYAAMNMISISNIVGCYCLCNPKNVYVPSY